MILVDTWVAGKPKTKGSMIARPNGSMYDSVIGSGTWRALMAGAVRDDRRRRWAAIFCDADAGGSCSHGAHLECGRPTPWPGPVAVYVDAYLPPPEDPGPGGASIRRTWYERALAMLNLWRAPVWEQSGDLDKLVRNVLDAIGSTAKNTKYRGGAIVDDVLVCSLVAAKHVAYAGGHPAGVSIMIRTLDQSDTHGRLRP